MNFIIKYLCIVFCLTIVFAEGTIYGENIDPDNSGAQYCWGENMGWLNFEPSQGPGVTVSNGFVTGFVWAENIGWINLSPSSFGGVTNDGTGNLAGYAWGENVGWISFSCQNTSSCGTVNYGVTIGANGLFDGYAWGENIGWINFKMLNQPASRVKTAWQEQQPTFIKLSSFKVRQKRKKIEVVWKTSSETDNLGFNILRSRSAKGKYRKINKGLIKAKGSSISGERYIFRDKKIKVGNIYYYKLEDIDKTAGSSFSGPKAVKVKAFKKKHKRKKK